MEKADFEYLRNRVEKAKKARYIKLGKRQKDGNLEYQSCLTDKTLKIGFSTNEPDVFDECMRCRTAEGWEKIGAMVRPNSRPNKQKDAGNQIRMFFEADEETLWFTFFNRTLYWTITSAGKEDIKIFEGGISRSTEKWRNCTLYKIRENEQLIYQSHVSGKIAQVSSYMETICGYDSLEDGGTKQKNECLEYIKQVILGGNSKATEAVVAAYNEFLGKLGERIGWLHHTDFEVMTEIIFSRDGWRRVTESGNTMDLVDLELEHVTAGMRAGVQVKSRTNKKDKRKGLEYYLPRLGAYERIYWVYHQAPKSFSQSAPQGYRRSENIAGLPSFKPMDVGPELILIGPNELPRMVVNAGLVEWLFLKTAVVLDGYIDDKYYQVTG